MLVSDSAIERTLSRSIAQAAAVRASALTTAQLAARLGKHPSRVRHLAREGGLAKMSGSGRSTLFPAWQLEGPDLVPGLPDLLAGLPVGLGAVSLARFVTMASPELVVGDVAVSPRSWLLAGGSVVEVLAAAGGLDGPS